MMSMECRAEPCGRGSTPSAFSAQCTALKPLHRVCVLQAPRANLSARQLPEPRTRCSSQPILVHGVHPAETAGHFACHRQLERLAYTGDDGVKMVCDPSAVLLRPPACTVVSIGSNGDASFERAVPARATHS